MMYNRMLPLIHVLLMLSVLFDFSTAAHEEGESSFCSRNESGEMESGLDLQSLVSTCFGKAFASPVPYISICDSQGKLNCDSIRRVMSIIPSCYYCENTAIDRESCYIGQKRGANCSINYLLKRMYCVKSRGTCELQMFHESSQSLQDVTTMEETTIVHPEVTTAATQYAEKHYYRDEDYEKYKKKDCAPCECSQTEKQTKVSVGVAVGLLFLGIVIGIIITAVICICAPSLHSRASIFRGKITEKYQKSRTQNTSQHQQDMHSAVADNTLPAESAITYPVVPTAPPASSIGSNQARYHTLDAMSNARNSHTYTGLQPNSSEYNEPMEGGNGYGSPEIQPIKGANTVVSPVYQEFTDNIISSTGINNKNKTDNGPMRNSDTNDAANHTYFVLEAQNEASKENTDDNGRPLSEHQYFVLEEQDKQQTPSNITDKTDPEYHQYFVLEKKQI